MLYKPEKYKLLVGNQTNLALCTCWLDPFSLTHDINLIKSKFSITGTLYSKEGVSIIIRNLALNPNIRYLFLWSRSALSNTPYGKAGRELLVNIFNNPIDLSELHKEVRPDILTKIVNNVKLIDITDNDLPAFLNRNLSEYNNYESYMSPVDFKEPERDSYAPSPSEKVGWVVRGDTIYEAWLNGLERIMRYGHIKKTEYGNNMRELHHLTWVITKEDINNTFMPDIDKKVKDLIGFSDESLQKYKDSLLDPNIPEGAAYTYGSRLRSYNQTLDQIDNFIKKLNECSISRRVVATTLFPSIDLNSTSPPCLTQIQTLTDDNDNLTLFATFRSHDIFKAAIPNAYGLLNLQKYICEKTNLEMGQLSITSVSAHIYEEDWDNARQLLQCQKYGDINFRFNENNEKDPRGNVKIYLAGIKIRLELTDSLGNIYYDDSGTSGIDLAMKLAKLKVLSRYDHMANITYELTKADVCLQNGIEYIQDRPLRLNSMTLNTG